MDIIKLLFLVFAFMLVAQVASGYQQSYLTFKLDDSWKVVEQRQAAQLFEKGSMMLEIRNMAEKPNLDSFASEREGKVLKTAQYGKVQAAVVKTDEVIILGVLEGEKEYYGITLLTPESSLPSAEAELKKLSATFSFSPTQSFETAPWERELVKPPTIGFVEKHPIPWGWMIFWAVVIGLVSWIIVRKRKKREKTEEKKKK